MNINLEFISSLLTVGKKEFLDTVKVIKVDFLSGMEKKIYIYILNYYKKYSNVPTKEVLLRKFPKLSIYKPQAELDYYKDEILNNVKLERMTKGLAEVQEQLLNENIDDAEKVLLETIKKIYDFKILDEVTLGATLIQRLQRYKEAKLNKGVIGLQTKVEKLDNHIGGVQDEMMVIMGRRGIGKTFFLLFLAKNFAYQIKKGMAIVSNELSEIKIGARLDSIFAEVSYSKYRKGQCSPEEEKRLLALKKLYKKLPPIHIINGAGKSAEEVGYELEALDIDVFFVDGLYLQNQGKSDPFNNTLLASREYQGIVRSLGVPGVFSTQATKDDETKYARAIEEDADMVFMMKQSPALKDEKIMEFMATKIREEDSDLRFWNKWDFDNWDFSTVNLDEADISLENTFEV